MSAARGGQIKANPSVSKTQRNKSLKRLFGYLLSEKLKVVTMLICGAIAVFLIVLGPKIMGQGTNVLFAGLLGKMLLASGIPAGTPKDEVVKLLNSKGQGSIAQMVNSMDVKVGEGIDWNWFAIILVITAAVYLVSILLRLVQNFIMTRVVSDTVYLMRRQIEDKLNNLPLNYFDRVPRGEVMSRTTNDVDNISQTLQQVLGELLFSIFQFVGVFIMMLSISPLMTLIAFIVIPIMALVSMFIMKKAQPNFTRQWARTGKLNSNVEEMFSGHLVVRAYGQQKNAEDTFDKHNQGLYEVSRKAQSFSGLIQPSTGFFGNLMFVLVAVIGGVRVLNGNLTLGDLQAFTQYSRQASQPLGQIASMSTILQSSLASSTRVFEFLDEPEESADTTTPEVIPTDADGRIQGHVKFNHVAFSYDPEEPLIEDLSIDAKPGKTVAIVGPTGAGKTTLVNLLMRFYEIQGGAITIDGVDTASMTRQGLRTHFGMVLQDTWLFDGTIRENLFYGVHEGRHVGETEMIEAAKATHVDEFVRKLPQGYDTLMNEDSSELSQGERQLITICRAFLSDPDILILDEATSSVDTRTEMLVQQAMNALRANRTSFVIAHRLSTIRDADLILVVNHGSIVEQGNHDELLAKNGAYAKLYNSQFSGAAQEEE
ncbi:MAG: ABC transporter ATP-binding protein/permease [Bifidobacteriaceae bacterium]|jgi:ATP-binding cassette subfamily B protein|nr:ABC transporter ATP-binding protein/permease [Bifidobacteriaceae bacterium]MCI1914157.1 ABC transporter ATP-binding protein/permease [Bifidobacteriaceae bacterium]